MHKSLTYIAAILISLSAVDAQACSCLSVPDKQRHSEASDVFIGTVIETKLIRKTEKFDEHEVSTDYVEAKIRKTKTIKGEASEYTEVLDKVANGANCAIGLITGRDYLFYLYDDNVLSICEGSRLYNEFADRELIEEMSSY